MTKRQKGEKITDDMKAYLQLQFKISPSLDGDRAEKIACYFKSTKDSINRQWVLMRKANP